MSSIACCLLPVAFCLLPFARAAKARAASKKQGPVRKSKGRCALEVCSFQERHKGKQITQQQPFLVQERQQGTRS
jgi:hypothetical protein